MLQIHLVNSPVFVCYRLVPFLLSFNICLYLSYVLFNITLLVIFPFLIHIKTWKEIIYKGNGCSIICMLAAFFKDLLSKFVSSALSMTVCFDQLKIIGIKCCLSDKFLYHHRHLMSIYRTNDSNTLCLINHITMNRLRNTNTVFI